MTVEGSRGRWSHCSWSYRWLWATWPGAGNQTQVFCRSCRNSKLLSPFSRPYPLFWCGRQLDVHLYENKNKNKKQKSTHMIREAFIWNLNGYFKTSRGALSALGRPELEQCWSLRPLWTTEWDADSRNWNGHKNIKIVTWHWLEKGKQEFEKPWLREEMEILGPDTALRILRKNSKVKVASAFHPDGYFCSWRCH